MTRDHKILAVAGALIALLFVGSVVASAGGDEGDAGAPLDGVVGVLGDWIGGATGADRADLSAGCFDGQGRLAIEGTCTLRVAPSDVELRTVRLRAEQPVTVTARLPRGDRAATADLAAGDSTTVAVDGRGGDIRLDCAGTCLVSIVDGE